MFNKQVLIDWARAQAMEHARLFLENWVSTMEDTIKEIEDALVTLGKGTPWSSDTKISADFLEPLFAAFFKKLQLPNLIQKTNYHTLVQYVPVDQIDPEVTEVLDNILL